MPILHRREPELSSSTYLLLLLRLCSGLAKPSPHRLWFFFWAQRFCSTWLAQPSRAGPLFPCCPKPPRAGAVQAQPTFIHKSFQPHLLLSHLLFLEDFRLFLLFNSPQRVSLLCSILQVSLCPSSSRGQTRLSASICLPLGATHTPSPRRAHSSHSPVVQTFLMRDPSTNTGTANKGIELEKPLKAPGGNRSDKLDLIKKNKTETANG